MSKITKRALISSLLATTVVAPAIAQQDRPSTPQTCFEKARRACGHDLDATEGPAALPAAELLADGHVHDRVVSYLRRSYSASPEEAEDAAQEAAMRALQKGVRSCCAQTFAGWMRRTGQNALFDMRKKHRESSLSDEPEKLDAAVGPTHESGPGDMLAIREEVDSMLAHHDLDRMTADKKTRLGLALGEHLTGGHVTRPTRLVDELGPALRELSRTRA